MEELEPSSKIMGPSILINKTSTLIVEPGWQALVTSKRNISLV